MPGRQTIEEVLAAARARIRRYLPEEARAIVELGAVLVDTRSDGDVRAEGRIPGSVYIHRNVLEWRCDPSSGYSDPRVNDLEARLIVVCNDVTHRAWQPLRWSTSASFTRVTLLAAIGDG